MQPQFNQNQQGFTISGTGDSPKFRILLSQRMRCKQSCGRGRKRGQFLILSTPRPASSGDTRDGSEPFSEPTGHRLQTRAVARHSFVEKEHVGQRVAFELRIPVKSLGALGHPLVHALFGIPVPVGRSKLRFLAA